VDHILTHKFELKRDFCTMHLPTKFHLPMFNRLEVTMLTTDATENYKNLSGDAMAVLINTCTLSQCTAKV